MRTISISYLAWLATPTPRHDGGECVGLNFAREESALLMLSDSMTTAGFRAATAVHSFNPPSIPFAAQSRQMMSYAIG